MDVAQYEITYYYYYYNKTYNFLQIIVMSIINYYYIIYNQLNYFACANAVNKVHVNIRPHKHAG